MTRTEKAFTKVKRHAVRKLPWLRRLRLRHCREADQSHLEKWRQFAHSCHLSMKVCIARHAEKELTDAELLGLHAHEAGHIIADALGFPEHVKARKSRRPGTPFRTQAEADWVVARMLGLPIRYGRRTIQEITPKAFRGR